MFRLYSHICDVCLCSCMSYYCLVSCTIYVAYTVTYLILFACTISVILLTSSAYSVTACKIIYVVMMMFAHTTICVVIDLFMSDFCQT